MTIGTVSFITASMTPGPAAGKGRSKRLLPKSRGLVSAFRMDGLLERSNPEVGNEIVANFRLPVTRAQSREAIDRLRTRCHFHVYPTTSTRGLRAPQATRTPFHV